ncbi:hypothetical protein Tco_0087441 [Tanacetum coccineum]
MATNEAPNAAGIDTRPPNVDEKYMFARQCPEPKRKMTLSTSKIKHTNGTKEKVDVLDAEAEAFLADVECTAPYDQPQALTTTNMFQANHEDAYDSDVDEGPNAAVAFMPTVYPLVRQQSSQYVHSMTIQSLTIVNIRTDISQKDEKPIKKRQNRTRDGKVCGDEAKSK